MEVVIRPIVYGGYEVVRTDAVSCAYDMDGFTPMSAVLSQLGLNRDHFQKCAHMHGGEKFRAISHGDEKPFVITTTKMQRWDSEPSATEQIMIAADAERCESLCMTHFAFIVGPFPVAAFMQCLRQIEQAKQLTNLRKIIVDVDENYLEVAITVRRDVQMEIVGSTKP